MNNQPVIRVKTMKDLAYVAGALNKTEWSAEDIRRLIALMKGKHGGCYRFSSFDDNNWRIYAERDNLKVMKYKILQLTQEYVCPVCQHDHELQDCGVLQGYL